MKLTEFLKSQKRETKFFIALDERQWRVFTTLFPTGHLSFLMMWCQGEDIFALFLEEGYKPVGIKTRNSMDRYLALSSVCPAAIIYERMNWELWGKEAMDAVDLRPWLDRGVWKKNRPLSSRPIPAFFPPEAYAYQEIADLHTVQGEIVTLDPISRLGSLPVFWRFSLKGNQILQAESLYGYTHRGIVSNLSGQSILDVLPMISRINALDSVAHQIAFSHAVEDIAGLIPSLDILRKRVQFTELSRISAYLLYLSRIFKILKIELAVSRCDLARELLMRWNMHHYGHRWLMDCVFPGSVRLDELHEKERRRFPQKVKTLYDQAKAIYQDMFILEEQVKHIGILSRDKAIEFNLGGFIGRASGRDTDLRRYMAEYQLEWLTADHQKTGDVHARIQTWFTEIEASFDMLDCLLQEDSDTMETGEETRPIIVETMNGEGVGVCEGVQGDIWYFIKVEAGKIKDIFIRDPAGIQAYVLQGILQNERYEHYPLIEASFGLLTTGVDL